MGTLTHCKPAREQTEHVAGGLQGVRENDRVDVEDRVLTPLPVNESAEEDVDDANEALSHEHTLPEIQRMTHFGHEGHEQEGSRVCVDHVVDGAKLVGEANDLLLVFCRGRTREGMDGIGRLDQSGTEHCLVIDGVLRRSNHDDDEVDHIQPHRQVAHPAESLEGPDRPRKNPHHGDNHDHDGETDFVLRDLAEEGGIAEHHHGDRKELLEGLSKVDEVAVLGSENTQDRITKTHHWEASGVQSDETLPDAIAGERGGDAKDDEESHTGTETHGGKDRATARRRSVPRASSTRVRSCDLRSARPAQNISGHQVKYGPPTGGSKRPRGVPPFRVGHPHRVVRHRGSNDSVLLVSRPAFLLTLLPRFLLLVAVAFGEPVHDHALDGSRSALLDVFGIFAPFDLAFDFRPVDVFFKCNRSICPGCKTPHPLPDLGLLLVDGMDIAHSLCGINLDGRGMGNPDRRDRRHRDGRRGKKQEGWTERKRLRK